MVGKEKRVLKREMIQCISDHRSSVLPRALGKRLLPAGCSGGRSRFCSHSVGSAAPRGSVGCSFTPLQPDVILSSRSLLCSFEFHVSPHYSFLAHWSCSVIRRAGLSRYEAQARELRILLASQSSVLGSQAGTITTPSWFAGF